MRNDHVFSATPQICQRRDRCQHPFAVFSDHNPLPSLYDAAASKRKVELHACASTNASKCG